MGSDSIGTEDWSRMVSRLYGYLYPIPQAGATRFGVVENSVGRS